MSKHIIIEWQKDSVILAVGARRGSSVEIEHFGLATAPAEGDQGPSLFAQMREFVQKFDVAKSPVTVVAPRESLEFRILNIPRGDANEIPDMVRFQATRQMANIGDTWSLDYILLPDNPSQEGLSALAATVSPAHMAEIESTCSDLGLQVARIVPRPIEIARYGVSAGELAGLEAALVIALSDTQADLLITKRGSLVQLRSTRMPEDPNAMGPALVAEIRRSLMAAASHMEGQTLARTVLIAAPDLASRLESALAQATNSDVKIVDPAIMLSTKHEDRHAIAHRAASRLASIGGVLCNATPDAATVLDLKNVKRPAPKKRNVKAYVYAGAAAAVLLLGGSGWWFMTNAQLDAEIASQQTEIASLKELSKNWKKMTTERADIDKFLAGSVNWLDQLETIATKIPSADEIVLTNPNLELMQDNVTARITVPVYAKSQAGIQQFESSLRDKTHNVAGRGPMKDIGEGAEYRWTANEEIRITNVGWDPLAKKNSAAKPAAQSSNEEKTSNNSKPAISAEPTQPVAPAAVTPASTAPAAEPPKPAVPAEISASPEAPKPAEATPAPKPADAK